MDNDKLQASSGPVARRRGRRGGRQSRPNLLNPANVAHQKTSTENRLRKQNYRFLQLTRQNRQVSHSAQEELKQFFQLSLADQAKWEELWMLSSEARRVWDRLSEERKAAQAKEHYLIPEDWWAQGKKSNREIEHIPNEKKGKGKGIEDEKEGEDNGDAEMEVWKGTEEEEGEGDEGERIEGSGEDDEEEGGVMLESEGEVIAPEPRSPFGS